jgi:RNA polymerase sigma-70 factor (ECF subfamily)
MGGKGQSGTEPGIPRDGPRAEALSDQGLEDLRRRVTSAVRRNCPPWLMGQAEDIVQNVLIKLIGSLRKSEGEKAFSALYLERSAYTAVVDEIRRVCRRREGPLESEDALHSVPSGRGDPEQHSSALEISRGILDCLSRLSRPRKLAVTLYLYGCTVPETAGRLRWHVKKTESLVYRGLAELRDCLTRKGLSP